MVLSSIAYDYGFCLPTTSKLIIIIHDHSIILHFYATNKFVF